MANHSVRKKKTPLKIDLATRSEIQSYLSDFVVQYFDGVDTYGSFWELDGLTVRPKSDTETSQQADLIPLIVYGGDAYRLGIDANATPTGQVFTSQYDSVTSVLIPANDGVYCNPLVVDDEGKLSHWVKVLKNDGQGLLAHWILERDDNEDPALYAMETLNDKVEIYKNALTFTDELVKNIRDTTNIIGVMFYDLSDNSNSFFITTKGIPLSTDRTSFSEVGNISIISSANHVTKIGDEFYAFTNAEDTPNAVYKTTESPVTGNWQPTDDYNIAKKLFPSVNPQYYLNITDFLETENTPIMFNTTETEARFDSISNLPVLWLSSGSAITVTLSASEFFNSVKTFDKHGMNFVGVDSTMFLHRDKLRTFRKVSDTQQLPAEFDHVMADLVYYEGNVEYSFELKGTPLDLKFIDSSETDEYLFGNVCVSDPEHEYEQKAMILRFPSNIPLSVEKLSAGHGTQIEAYNCRALYNLKYQNVYDFGSSIEINGPVSRLSGLWSKDNKISVLTAIPVLSSNGSDTVPEILVYIYNPDAPAFGSVHARMGYDWANPDLNVLFNDPDYPTVSPEGLFVQDILLLNGTELYVTAGNKTPDSSEPPPLSVFEISLPFYFPDDEEEEQQESQQQEEEQQEEEEEPLPPAILNLYSKSWSTYSINKVVKSPSGDDALIDFELDDVHTIGLKNGNTWSLPFMVEQNVPQTVTSARCLLDYLVMYNAQELSSKCLNILAEQQNILNVNELLGETQLAQTSCKAIDPNHVYTLSFDGTVTSAVANENVQYPDANSLIVMFEPLNTIVYTTTSTLQPTLPCDKTCYGISSMYANSSEGTALCAVHVMNMSRHVNVDGCFYAHLYDVEDVQFSGNPVYIEAENKYLWNAEPIHSNHRYALLSCNLSNGKIIELSSKSVPYVDSSLGNIIGPNSWEFLDSSRALPDVLSFERGSLVKTQEPILDINNWIQLNNVSLSHGSGKYTIFRDNKALTWNGDGNICRINLDTSTVDCTVDNTASKINNGQIAGLQNLNNRLVYVFAVYPREGTQEVDLAIYSGDYQDMDNNWTLTFVTSVERIDFLTSGSIYIATGTDRFGDDAEQLFYSGYDGGIKRLAKKQYSLSCQAVEALEMSFDGTVLKSENNAVLASGEGKLYDISQGETDLETTTVFESNGGVTDAWFNYKTPNMSSYTVINSNRHVTLVEISANGARLISTGIKTEENQEPPIYDVVPEPNASLSSQISFRSDNGITYSLDTIENSVPDSAVEVHDGEMLLSNMVHKYPTKEETEKKTELSAGDLLEFHVPYFTVDVGDIPSVYIDTLYSTTQLTDDFDQTYWITQLQLDNIVSSMSEDDEIVYEHLYQRIKLNEPYDQPLLFKTLYWGGTPSATVILTSRDRPIVYSTEKRADWDITHLRKACREQAHIDNITDDVGVNPDFVDILADIPVSQNTNVMLLQGGNIMAVYNSWDHNVLYFGSCVPPYTLFNSRLQEIYVPVISKYGGDDMNFVLGTNEGFIHLINGRLFAKSVYVDEDKNEIVLSGDCTYAKCHEIFDGTSIHNRFWFTSDHGLYHIDEHNFVANCDVKDLFRFTDEKVNDMLRIGDGSYVICTNKGFYTAQPKMLIRDYLDDYMLSDLNNVIDREFAHLLTKHREARHFAGSDMDIINKKIDVNFNPYPTGFTDVSPVVTSRHVLDVDNDLVDTMEVRITDSQAAARSSNVFAAVKNTVITGIAAGTRSYAPAGWYDRVVDPNNESHVVDYSDIRYICRRWHSGIVEFYIYVPTTFTYYMNNLAGYSQSPYTGLELVRPNIQNMQLANDVNKQCTYLRLYLNNTFYKINTLYTVEIVGNSLPLKVYMDSTYCDSNKAGLFDTLVEPSVVRSLPLMVGRSKNNVNQLLNASNQICLEFAVYGSDAQAVHIMAR